MNNQDIKNGNMIHVPFDSYKVSP